MQAAAHHGDALLLFFSRKDGIYPGGNSIVANWNTTPYRAQTEKVVHVLQELMKDTRG